MEWEKSENAEFYASLEPFRRKLYLFLWEEIADEGEDQWRWGFSDPDQGSPISEIDTKAVYVLRDEDTLEAEVPGGEAVRAICWLPQAADVLELKQAIAACELDVSFPEPGDRIAAGWICRFSLVDRLEPLVSLRSPFAIFDGPES